MIPLSVLDLATVASGSTPAQALTDTISMAGVVEKLGYKVSYAKTEVVGL